ncbi:hypothetical protein FIA58_014585 [Flavobacterium jejuense]|uniref:EcsC protein family protein n=1 Tax=Flavobacterium jejuense TaxID=1544455 RepID=A0ABX0IST9_9FLAO|nr:hypothetical protein [Flavobacterium jejuense]NHN26909.1 hypothetical protein [Flavobacterium jejuense]
MKKVDQNQLLDEKIRLLKKKQLNDFSVLKEQFFVTAESLKPVNIIKETIHDFKNSKDIKNSLLESALGIAGGFVTRKMIIGKSSNIFKKISATVIQYLVSNFITNKAEKININEKDIQNSAN